MYVAFIRYVMYIIDFIFKFINEILYAHKDAKKGSGIFNNLGANMKNELPLSTDHRLLCYEDNSFNDAIAFSHEYISETLAVISDIS